MERIQLHCSYTIKQFTIYTLCSVYLLFCVIMAQCKPCSALVTWFFTRYVVLCYVLHHGPGEVKFRSNVFLLYKGMTIKLELYTHGEQKMVSPMVTC